jgi:hypothetical protein
MPVGKNYGAISTISDLVNSYHVLLPNEITYKFFNLNFDQFFYSIIDDIKNNFYLVSLTASLTTQEKTNDKIIYLRYDMSNEYE